MLGTVAEFELKNKEFFVILYSLQLNFYLIRNIFNAPVRILAFLHDEI